MKSIPSTNRLSICNFSRRSLCLLALSLAALSPSLQAQDKPPLKIVVGFPPGGSADILARAVADALREDFGTIVVDNKPGAGGRIALNAVKIAKPDGQTVIVLPSGPMVLFPHVYKKLDYDAVKDFTPVSQIARFQFGVVSGPASNVKNVAEMVAKAKSDPGNASYGTPGAGTLPHFMGVLMEQSAGISLNHVPFQGGAPANNALLGGHIGYKFDVVSETAEMHRTGKVRIIAVTGSQRDPQVPEVPEVPTLKESGINMDATAWFAMYGPAGLKGDALGRLEKAMMKIARDPAMKDKMLKLGYEPIGTNSVDLAAAQKADLKRWEKPIKATGVQLD
nr:tripartite tricarboxylate transporter substrate-binding protein [uncultured Limnohabitans sp.]